MIGKNILLIELLFKDPNPSIVHPMQGVSVKTAFP